MMRKVATPIIWTSVLVLNGLANAPAEAQAPQTPSYDPDTHTYTVREPSLPRSTAPSSPMDYRDALKTWDGTGELLLAPGASVQPNQTFGIGATFDNSDAPADRDLDADERADRRCIAGTLWFNIEDGRLRLSQGTGEHSPQSPLVRSSPQTPGLTFANRRCRYHLALTIKIPKDGGWTAVAEPPRPPPPPPPAGIGPVIHLKAGETFELVGAPSPQELIPLPLTSGTGQRLPDDLKGHCPRLSGMVYFESRGVFFEMPWKADPPMTPGLVRDPEARATTLIFQSPACRDEIRVTREIEHDGVWQPSSLSADPK